MSIRHYLLFSIRYPPGFPNTYLCAFLRKNVNVFNYIVLQWSSAQPFQYLPTLKWQEVDVKRALPSLEQPVFSTATRDINALKAHMLESVMLTKHGVVHLSNVKVRKTIIWSSNSEYTEQATFCLHYTKHVQHIHNLSCKSIPSVYLYCKVSGSYILTNQNIIEYHYRWCLFLDEILFLKQRFKSFLLIKDGHWFRPKTEKGSPKGAG